MKASPQSFPEPTPSNAPSLQETLLKLNTACTKQNKDAVQHYTHTATSILQKSPSSTHFRTLYQTYLSAGSDLFYKTSILRIIEQIVHVSTYTVQIRQCLDTIMDVMLFLEEEQENSGSSSTLLYLSDCKRILTTFKKHVPVPSVVDDELTRRERHAHAKHASRTEAMHRIQTERENHKKVRESKWRVDYTSTHNESGFNDGWERIQAWNEKDDEDCLKHSEYYNAT